MTAVAGIDPGLSGAIAVLALDGLLTVTGISAPSIVRSGRAKRAIDRATLSAVVRTRPVGAVPWIHRVGAMPGQGMSSMLAFGRAVGVVEGVLAALAIPVSYATPQAWKRALAVPAGKDDARLRASQLLPGYAANWQRAKDDGRAEAALIALYGVGRAGFE